MFYKIEMDEFEIFLIRTVVIYSNENIYLYL